MVLLKSKEELKKSLEDGKKFYLYGAGKVYRKIIVAVCDDIIAVIDKNYSQIISINSIEIVSPELVFTKEATYDVICALDPTFDYMNRTLQLCEELSKFNTNINVYLLDYQRIEDDGIIVWGDKNLLYDNRKFLISGKSDFVRSAYSPEIVADAEYLRKLNEEPYAFVLYENGIGFEAFNNGMIVHSNGRKDWVEGKPKEYSNRILLFGDSRVSGMLLENRHTIAAELQKNLNEMNISYAVENYAIPGRDIERMVWQIKNTNIIQGDIVILGSGFYEFDNADINALVWAYYIEEASLYVKNRGAVFFYMNLPTMIEMGVYSEAETEALLMFNSTEFLDYTFEKIRYYKNVIKMECVSHCVCFIDMALAFARRKEYGQVWINLHHYGPHGSKLIADELKEYIIPLLKYKSEGYLYKNANKEKEERSKEFENKLANMKNEDNQIFKFADNIKNKMTEKWGEFSDLGCIVMNANPFTKGHMHLVKEALKEVEYLLVLVVEEDLSEISFMHRYNIVLDNLSEIQNVFVAPGGKYTISKSTFPEYFQKDVIQGKKINAETDVRIFAERIAPRIGIQKRFVGEEPFDEITKQYNETMKNILDGYGIELIEIPRLSIDEEIISATVVRDYIKKGDTKTIANFLTKQTYDYILANEVLL